MSDDAVGYTLSRGVWVPPPLPEARWNGRYWVRGRQYSSDESAETWAAGLDAVLGPEEIQPFPASAHTVRLDAMTRKRQRRTA